MFIPIPGTLSTAEISLDKIIDQFDGNFSLPVEIGIQPVYGDAEQVAVYARRPEWTECIADIVPLHKAEDTHDQLKSKLEERGYTVVQGPVDYNSCS